MPVAYATAAQYELYYTDKGIASGDLSSAWLPYGADRVNIALGMKYTTPFSTNNFTAQILSIDYAHLGILIRTRPEDDSNEMRIALENRINALLEPGAVMFDDSGNPISQNLTTTEEVESNTKSYKPIFDTRPAERERVDPDRLNDEALEDIS